MKRLLATICMLVSLYDVNGQGNRPVEKWLEYVETLAEEIDDDEQMETLHAELSYLSEHPYDLNTVTAEMLKRLPFLSDGQIESLIAYRQRYGGMATIFELKNIEALDWATIDLLQSFVYVDMAPQTRRALNAKNLKHGSQELVVRLDRTFPLKQGYLPLSDSALQQSPNSRYLGEPYYHALRYSYTFDDRLQAGLVMEKDAGEPFMNSRHKGYDYYSAHLLVRNTGWLKTLVAGDYTASFGQGLTLSHDFSPRMSTILSQSGLRNNGFRRHYSTGESTFFRGMASTVNWKNIDLSLFYSFRKVDGTVDAENNLIVSFKTDGLHRQANDMEKKNAISAQVYGGNIRYEASSFAIGITALTYGYGRLSVAPEPHPYNRYYFRGSQNMNVGADYQFRHNRFSMFGEAAISKNGAVAAMSAIQWTPASFLSGLILFRSYARDYQAYLANAFSQNSDVQNEQGLYTGLKITPVAHWSFSGYADFFRFPWMKYGVDAPSSGQEYLLQADYAADNKYAVSLRYRYRRKESGRIVDLMQSAELLPYGQRRLKAQFIFTPQTTVTLRTAADLSHYDETQGKQSHGLMISQSTAWKPPGRLQADLFLAYFRTDDYDSRISSYEKKLLYVYNTIFLYGKGLRCAVVARWFLLKRLALSVKTGWTHYTDRNLISSGLETIIGKNRLDLSLMLRRIF
jgi:hypothetical protein